MNTVLLSAGSNLGDKEENLKRAFDALESSGVGSVKAVSRFYKTEPVDYTDQEWFVNAVIRIETDFSPLDLLVILKEIEVLAGRDFDAVRFGPRVLDLDILLYNDLVLESEKLTVPHPRMHKRSFVLTPLCDIDSELMHPVIKKTMGRLLSEIDTHDQRVEGVGSN